MDKKKKIKRKVRYTLMLISDCPSDSLKQISMKMGTFQFLRTTLLIVLMICITLSGYTIITIRGDLNMTLRANKEITDLEKENQYLTSRNEELEGKVLILSDTVNQKVEAEIKAAAQLEELYLPKGYPLGGPASMEEGDNIIVFTANQGIPIVASGKGLVVAISEDEEYGHQIKIDHQNGYATLYRCKSEVKVAAGDEIERGTVLFEMQENDQKLGYQILLNDEFVQPLEIMEIYG